MFAPTLTVCERFLSRLILSIVAEPSGRESNAEETAAAQAEETAAGSLL